MKTHFKTFKEAKEEFKRRTGQEFNHNNLPASGLRIFKRKNKKLLKRFFVGTFMDWLQL